MNYTTLAIGLVALAFGVYTLIVRIKKTEKFGKLNTMKKMSGETTGTAKHTISYTVIHIIAGIIFILLGLKG